jgi:hypothetical protein
MTDEEPIVVPPDEKGQMSSPAFREALRRSQGAWKDNPWKNCIEDINAMRDEWEAHVMEHYAEA